MEGATDGKTGIFFLDFGLFRKKAIGLLHMDRRTLQGKLHLRESSHKKAAVRVFAHCRGILREKVLGQRRAIRRQRWQCLFRHLLLADFLIYRQ